VFVLFVLTQKVILHHEKMDLYVLLENRCILQGTEICKNKHEIKTSAEVRPLNWEITQATTRSYNLRRAGSDNAGLSTAQMLNQTLLRLFRLPFLCQSLCFRNLLWGHILGDCIQDFFCIFVFFSF